MRQMEYGTVDYFNDIGNFGFLIVLNADDLPTGERLFFHYHEGYIFKAGHDSEIRFLGKSNTKYKVNRNPLKQPEKGDKLIFVRGRGPKGDRVAGWGYAWQYDEVMTSIKQRPVFRLVRATSNCGQQTTVVVWEGQDVSQLSASYPKYLRDGEVCDCLEAVLIDSGTSSWRYFFEQKTGDIWKRCDDPRVYLCCLPLGIQREVMNRSPSLLHYDYHCPHNRG